MFKQSINFISNNFTPILSIFAVSLLIFGLVTIVLSAIIPQTMAFILQPALTINEFRVISSFIAGFGLFIGGKIALDNCSLSDHENKPDIL